MFVRRFTVFVLVVLVGTSVGVLNLEPGYMLFVLVFAFAVVVVI